MRGGGKISSPALNHRLRRSPLSRRTRGLCWIMDSATSPSAPRRMTALVEVSENQMKIMGGGGQSCACGVESDLLAYLPVSFTQTWFKRVYYWTFPITLYAGLSELFMEVTLFIKLSSSCWHLRICSQCFQHVILHEGFTRSCRIHCLS